MLHHFDETLKKLLYEEGRLNRSEIDIAFDQPTGEWASRLARPTLNCWCYDLRENVKLRTMERQEMVRNNNMARAIIPPRRIDVSYLVTAWARKVEDEHQLLWRALSVFKRFPALNPDECEGDLRYQQHDIPLLVADMSNNMVNMVDLWSVLDNQMRLGFIMVATLELDTELVIEAPMVLESVVRLGESFDPTDEELTGSYTEIHRKVKGQTEEDIKHKRSTVQYVDKRIERKPEEGGE